MRTGNCMFALLLAVCLAGGCKGKAPDAAEENTSAETTQPTQVEWKEAEPTRHTEEPESEREAPVQAQKAAPDPTEPLADEWEDPEAADLMKKLGSNSPEDVSKAFHALERKGTSAIPALKKGLSHKELRCACVEILTRVKSVECTTVLLEALKKALDKTTSDQRFKLYIIGGLGRLKDDYVVAELEKLYEQQKDKKTLLSISIAWALENTTGNDYGPAYDPWMHAKTVYPPPIGVKGPDE
jgi:hypothetical protein